MVRSKWLLLIILVGICLSACGEVVPSPSAAVGTAEITVMPGLTAPNSSVTTTAVTTASPIQTQAVSTTVFATTASPAMPFTTRIVDTTVSHSNPVFGAVYLAETLDGGLSWSPLITQTNLQKDEFTGFDKLDCIPSKICAHIKAGAGDRYSYFDLVKEGKQLLKPIFKLDDTDISCLSQTECWEINNGSNWVSATRDGGTSWQSLTRDKELTVNAANKDIYLKARRNPGIDSEIAFTRAISCSNSQRCLLVGSGGRSIRTVDGGLTWEWFFTDPVFYFEVVCLSDQTCYAAGRDAVAITTNFGESWQILKTGIGDVKAISCPTLNDCMMIGEGKTIYSTHDKGATWSTYSTPASGFVYDLSCPDTKNCYAVSTTHNLIITHDGGQTWTTRPLGLNNFKNFYSSISCPNTTHCYINSKEFS